jgi:hypothetical protein
MACKGSGVRVPSAPQEGPLAHARRSQRLGYPRRSERNPPRLGRKWLRGLAAALVTTFAYESGGLQRLTSKALPTGAATVYAYYTGTDSAVNACG